MVRLHRGTRGDNKMKAGHWAIAATMLTDDKRVHLRQNACWTQCFSERLEAGKAASEYDDTREAGDDLPALYTFKSASP